MSTIRSDHPITHLSSTYKTMTTSSDKVPTTPHHPMIKLSTNILGEQEDLGQLLSAKKPKNGSLLKRLDKSAKKLSNRRSIGKPPSDDQVQYLLDLGIPKQPVFDTTLTSEPIIKRKIRPRLSGPVSQKPLTPIQTPGKKINAVLHDDDDDEKFEMMFKNMKVSDDQPSSTSTEPQINSKTGRSTNKSRRTTIVHISHEETLTDPQEALVSKSVSDLTHEGCETGRCDQHLATLDVGTTEEGDLPDAEVEEDSEEDEIKTRKNSKDKHRLIVRDSESESDGDEFEPSIIKTRTKVKISDTESDEEEGDDLEPSVIKTRAKVKMSDTESNEEEEEDEPSVIKTRTKVRISDTESEEEDDIDRSRSIRSKTSVKGSDREVEDILQPRHQSLSISHNRRQPSTSTRTVALYVNSSESDDSIEVEPQKLVRSRLNTVRALPEDDSSKPLVTRSSPRRNKLNQQDPTIIDLTHSSPPNPLPNPIRSKPHRRPQPQELPFQSRRDDLAKTLIERLNRDVFDSKLPPELSLVWSKRLNTTAGKAKWSVFKDGNGKVIRDSVVIELGTKVVDSEIRLMNTLAHELCHVATWIIDRQKDEKHGQYFKAWARKIHRLIPQIEVTTRHTYEIDFKFKWTCAVPECTKTYGRHSNSIKPDRQMCACGGTLVPVPRPRKKRGTTKEGSNDDDGLAELMENLIVRPKI